MIALKLNKKILLLALTLVVLLSLFSVSVFADETGDVAGAVEDTWLAARGQIKDVVNKVVFPVIDVVLAVLFFTKVATAYLDYRKHGQFEWGPPAILLATLIFSLTCPMYIWSILGF
jgi:hypothetical protein